MLSATPGSWTSQCSQSHALDSTRWCSLHCRHTFCFQLCITMLQQHLHNHQSISCQPDGFATRSCGDPDYTHWHSQGWDFSAPLWRQQTVGGLGWHIFPANPAYHSAVCLQHPSTSSLMTTHAGVWAPPTSLSLSMGSNTYTPGKLFSRDSWELGWCFDISTNIFSQLFFYLAEKPLVGVVSQRKWVFSLL